MACTPSRWLARNGGAWRNWLKKSSSLIRSITAGWKTRTWASVTCFATRLWKIRGSQARALGVDADSAPVQPDLLRVVRQDLFVFNQNDADHSGLIGHSHGRD